MANEDNSTQELSRGLSQRHVQMMAIGGTIGTGLFLGAGDTINLTGPSVLFIYMITGLFLFFMMRAIGEMLYVDPDSSSFVSVVSKYINRESGYFVGWSYWITLILPAMAELTAIAQYIQYWLPHIAAWEIELAIMAILILLNLTAVRFFGETEFWFASIKIIAILVVIFIGLFMMITGFKTPGAHGGVVGIHNITDGFQFFPNGSGNFLKAFPMVFFSFVGIEFVGLMSAETMNPRVVIPKVINSVLLRILLFYVGSLSVIMAICSWRYLPKSESPFVMVFQLVGLHGAAAIMNFVVLTAALSALNTLLYSAGRDIFALSKEHDGRIERYFSKLSKTAIPARAIMFSAALICITPLVNFIPVLSSAFNFFASATAAITLVIYTMIMIAHRRYRKSDDFMPDGFKMPGYRFTSPATIAFFGFIFVMLFLTPTDQIAAIGGILWTIGFGIFTHYYMKH
ncbi:L-asparagine transporter-like permease [Weissella uvarum]|uniref:amino acid permease n=1 Tax=Weissella uvarum TaxID=1479233 RepID=UPI0019611A95|nr:amino acid permease [Weissella uvarum]MBM7617225.1 L-asparagine transporter-like permease [Weissella uvarum]MCM0595518.1 amino acid permease [Weissella uvarum]